MIFFKLCLDDLYWSNSSILLKNRSIKKKKIEPIDVDGILSMLTFNNRIKNFNLVTVAKLN